MHSGRSDSAGIDQDQDRKEPTAQVTVASVRVVDFTGDRVPDMHRPVPAARGDHHGAPRRDRHRVPVRVVDPVAGWI